jgi:hypothetical protein
MRGSTVVSTLNRPAHALRDCGDVSAVRLDVDRAQFVAICGCGWRTPAAEHVRDAIFGWFAHRDRLS